MGTHKISPAEIRKAKAKAQQLLRSTRFFNEFLTAVRKAGLVGEEKNALVLLIVAVSRLLNRPLNVIVKGQSASGKNWLVTRVLRLMPSDAVREISSTSRRAWNYSKDDFRHRVVYIQERNKATGEIHPVRLMISEGRVVRLVTAWEKGLLITKKYVARGPVAAISTTTSDRLEIDDETRHISLWVDESMDQTHRILRAYGIQNTGLTPWERRVWRTVHRLLELRGEPEIKVPRWFEKLADRVVKKDVRVRRYYPAFVEACKAVCLIRSFQRPRKDAEGILTVDFADFALATMIFDDVFVESLHRVGGPAFETGEIVRKLYLENNRVPVQARDLAKELGVSLDRAYERLRDAVDTGTVRRANRPEKGNKKLYAPSPRGRFLPAPEEVFRQVSEVGNTVRLVHPISGEQVVYKRRPDKWIG